MRKRAFSTAIILTAAIICALATPAQAKYGGGTGEPNDPYRIYDANQMNTIGLDANDWDKSFVLMNDIDLGAYSGTQYNLIGTASDNAFTGSFDGNSKTVLNFTYNDPNRDYVGLFGCLGISGRIGDLNVVDANVLGDTSVGIIAGDNNGQIIDCTAGGKVAGGTYVAGIAGMNWADLTNCFNLADVNATTHSCGGLTGNNRGTILDSCNTGNINSGTMAGGAVGYNLGTINNCYNRGGVAASENCGGLIGKNRGTVSNCYSAASVTSAGSYAGGLIGYTTMPLEKCFWDTDLCPGLDGVGNSSDPEVVGKTTAEMKTPQTFLDAGWDLFSHWNATPDEYPELFMYLLEYPGGDGSEGDPFQIAVGPQLLIMAADTDNYDKHFILIDDIDMAGHHATEAIIAADIDNSNSTGHGGVPFTGVFDGQGHTIYNLNIDGGTQNDYIGLFGCTESQAVVRNINIEDANVVGDKSVGILVGINDRSDVNNCSVSGYVRGHSEEHYGAGGLIGFNYQGTVSNSSSNVIVSGKENVGGLIGFSWIGDITNCSSVATVTGDYVLEVSGTIGGVGGLIGTNIGGEHTIRNCYSQANIYMAEYFNGGIGGLVGMNKSDIVDCHSNSDINASALGVGGLVGENSYGSIIACSSSSSVVGPSCVGGILGFSGNSTVTDSYNTGNVNSIYDRAGGIVAYQWSNSVVTNCFNSGNISGVDAIGGIVGENDDSTVSGCFNDGSIASTQGDWSYVGGIAGVNMSNPGSVDGMGVVVSCYNLGVISGVRYGGGLVGRNSCEYGPVLIANCYSAGPVSGTETNSHIGAVIGENCGGASIERVFWDVDLCPDVNGIGNGSDPNVVGLPTVAMQSEVTFTGAGWDFLGETINGPNDVWAICEGTNYPKLVWSIPAGDIVCPDGVDFIDYSYLANVWGTADADADLDLSGIVDPNDLAILGEDWLKMK